MHPERWRQIESMFQAATDLPAAERGGYLAAACQGDPALQAEIEKLLGAHEQAGTFLEGAAPLDGLPPPDSGQVAGRRIGAYQLIQEIGRGGMGSVYLAARADEEFQQRVAIKLVQAGMDSESIVRRFRNERQILAGLDHPNIARLLDGGTTENGLPYFVMEYIEGQPIGSYCDDRGLDTASRLRLFQAVCSAVHYAHQNLIVHRDIKPGNILVTAAGVPKLLDFGIAKLISRGEPSGEPAERTAQVMTPEYASPEQVSCQPITTASDIYSLGVLLYELLTGQRPYRLRNRSPLEISQAICQQDPEKPSAVVLSTGALRGQLQGDLDNIVLKAMQKEPRRRYSSADQLGEDIRRYLEGRPVAARTATLAYRACKFARRHKAGVAAAALASMALAAGAGATLWEARLALTQRARAERRFNDVRRLANSFLFEFHDAIKDLPGSTPARSLVVRRALEYLESLAAESRGDRSLQREMATAYTKVADVQGNPLFPNLGDSRGALASYRKALAIREALSRAEPGNRELRRELAALYGDISGTLSFVGDTAGAAANSGHALAIYEALADRSSADFALQSDLVMSTYRHAGQLQNMGDIDGALAGYERAAERSRRIMAANPSNPAGKVHLATSLDGIAGIRQQKGDTAGALENRRQALAMREELVSADSNNAHYRRQAGFAHHNLGLSLAEAGDLAQALQHFRYELNLFESLRAADPTDVQARRNVSLAQKQIGDILIRMADWRGALEHFQRALDIDRQLCAGDSGNEQALLDLSFSQGKFGLVLGKLGKRQAALAILRQGIATQESLANKDLNDDLVRGFLANSYTRMAQCLSESGAAQAALEYYRKAVETRLNLLAKNPGNTANRGALAECYLNLGKALARQGLPEALEDVGQAIELLEGLQSDVNNAQYRIHLADASANAARLYAAMASHTGEPDSRRLQHLSKARSLYLRSQQLWLELDRGGKLAAVNRHWTRDVARELASSENSIAKLSIQTP